MAGNNNGRLTNAIGESLSPAAIKLTVPPGLRPARSDARLIVSRCMSMARRTGGRRRAGMSRPRRLAGVSGAVQSGRVFRNGPVRRNAGQRWQGRARRRQRVADVNAIPFA